MKRQYGKLYGEELVDMLGKPFKVGDKVVRGTSSGHQANLQIAEVTRIEGDKLYLSGSKVAINYPGRMLIINQLFADNAPVVQLEGPRPTKALYVGSSPARGSNSEERSCETCDVGPEPSQGCPACWSCGKDYKHWTPRE